MQKIKFKIPYLRKGYYLFLFVAIIFIVYMRNFMLDNDTWFLLNHGRYVLNFGIPYIEPFTIHENLNFVMQQWLSALIFYLCYHYFGIKSLLFLIIFCDFIIVFICYKLCMLISDNNYKISAIVTLIIDILLSYFYIISRPQIFTFIFVLLLFYCLESYVKTNKVKYLFLLPVISLLQINFHASMWWMLYIFMLPYLLDGYKLKNYQQDVYKKCPILITIVVMFLIAFINPYGLDAITYLFGSYGVDSINNLINEMCSLDVNFLFGKVVFVSIFLVFIIYLLIGKDKIKIRYFLLFAGTSYLAMSSNKGFSYFILASFFPMAYYLKSKVKILIEREKYSNLYKFNCLLRVLVIIIVFGILYQNVGVNYINPLEEGIDLLLEKYDESSIQLFVGYNQGGYTEFRGIKSYLDPRAEVFLMANNKKEDIFQEYYDVINGKINFESFLEKYNFTHLLICESERLYDDMDNIENYILFYEGKINDSENYKIYVRNDI